MQLIAFASPMTVPQRWRIRESIARKARLSTMLSRDCCIAVQPRAIIITIIILHHHRHHAYHVEIFANVTKPFFAPIPFVSALTVSCGHSFPRRQSLPRRPCQRPRRPCQRQSPDHGGRRCVRGSMQVPSICGHRHQNDPHRACPALGGKIPRPAPCPCGALARPCCTEITFSKTSQSRWKWPNWSGIIPFSSLLGMQRCLVPWLLLL